MIIFIIKQENCDVYKNFWGEKLILKNKNRWITHFVFPYILYDIFIHLAVLW